MIGELLDHYRVVELVGCGAMGVVYKALDVNLDRPVAIKVMGAAARNEPDFVERVRNQVSLSARSFSSDLTTASAAPLASLTGCAGPDTCGPASASTVMAAISARDR